MSGSKRGFKELQLSSLLSLQFYDTILLCFWVSLSSLYLNFDYNLLDTSVPSEWRTRLVSVYLLLKTHAPSVHYALSIGPNSFQSSPHIVRYFIQ